MRKDYEAPAIRELGSLGELTSQHYNKVGPHPDTFSTNPDVVGSVVPIP